MGQRPCHFAVLHSEVMLTTHRETLDAVTQARQACCDHEKTSSKTLYIDTFSRLQAESSIVL
eukprot:1710679-Amphidinium_carterae.1